MSRRNVVCPSCGRRGRARLLVGPRCGAPLLPTACPRCPGVEMTPDPTPPKNRKPAVAPDGRRRRHPTPEEWGQIAKEEARRSHRDAGPERR